MQDNKNKDKIKHVDPQPDHGKDNEKGHKVHKRPSGNSHALNWDE